jgi:hypothetical protein
VPFHRRLQPAPVGKGFRQDDYWVWCGSVVQGDDGRYHCFASRWSKRYPFFHGYLASSEVVRASSDTPEGPYTVEEVILPARGSEWWDGRMTHNPFIIKRGDEYLLFYIGATFTGDIPDASVMRAMLQEGPRNGRVFDWYTTIRIGMARSRSVFGPWERPDQPTFDVNPDGWDANVVTNPAPCLAPDGSILLFYRAGAAKLGLAIAETPDGPIVRQGDGPVVDPGDGLRIEDPCIWHDGERYQMVCKDLTGQIAGEFHAAIHLWSTDARNWQIADEPKAWSRELQWDDGTTTTQGSIERPFILLDEKGEPAWLFAATADGPGPLEGRPGFTWAENTWTMVRPLATPAT